MVNENIFYFNNKKIEPPVIYEELEAIMIFFPASYKEVNKLIGLNNIKPVKLFFNTTIIGITIFDYQKCPVGPYRELALSVPVIANGKFNIPLLPLIMDGVFKNFGFFTNLLVIDTEPGRLHGEKLYGYPTYENLVEVEKDENSNYISYKISENDNDILYVKLRKNKKLKLLTNKKYNTYFKKGGELVRVEMTASAKISERILPKDCDCLFGEHEITRKYISSVLKSNKPLKFIHYKNGKEILSKPVKL